MKELSIEEKAKRYDEAIKKAEVLYKTAEPMSGCNVLLETVFPELAETEDDKIKKELLENLKELLEMYNTLQTTKEYSKVQSWIAWLEKQGMPANYHDICDTCVRQPTCQSDCFLQQSEQKPADKVEPKWKPTDKDIFELQCVINNEPYNGFILKALLEQLKKLKEE